MRKQKTVTQTGFIIGGTATLSLWGGGAGTIEIEKYYIPYEKLTPKNILRCVNDNGFGCECITEAEIDIFIKYDNGATQYDRTLFVDNKIHTKYFLGWSELREQGIEC